MRLTRLSKLTPLGAAALAVVVAACGGSSLKAANAASSQSAAASSSGAANTGARQGPPGVSGTVAQVTPATGSTPLTLEVQGRQGQTTVFLTSATVVTQTVGTTSAALQPGRCVSATGTRTASGGVRATNVVVNLIDTAANCAGGARAGAPGGGGGAGGGGGFFRRGGGSNATTRPTLSPAQRQALAKLAVAAGKVLSLDPSTSSVTLQVPTPPSTAAGAGRGSSRPPFNLASSFTWTSSTKFSETETATIASVALNDCVTAFGSSNSTGQVTATRVSVQPPVNGSCNTGFGGGFGFGRLAGGGAGSGAGAGAAG